MTDFMIGLPPESRLDRFGRWLSKIHPTVWAAIIAGVIGLLGLWLGSCLQSGKLRDKIAFLTDQVSQQEKIIHEKTADIQRLETILTPFRTIAIEKFNKADADTLKTLAGTMTALQRDYAEALTKIAAQQTQIEMLRAKTSPRSLTSDQRGNLLKALRSAPRGEVSVTSDPLDAEARDYAKQIESVLKEAKCEVSPFPPSSIFAIGSTGVLILVNNGKAQPPHFGQLQQLFSQAGVEMQPCENPNVALTSNRVVIWVGQKP